MGVTHLTRGGTPIETQRTLQIHLVLEVSIPEDLNTFQGISLAFHRFQSFSAVTLFKTVLKSIQDQAGDELKRQSPDRFRNKGFQDRTWEMPFGTVKFQMAKWYDLHEKKVVYPLKVGMDVPDRVRYCEETLLPGFRLAVLQSFRVSRETQAVSHQGQTYGHSTLHQRFQDFAEQLDPVPDMAHQRGSKPTAFQQADGTKLAMQDHGRNAGKADLRLVVGSRTPQGSLEILDFSLGKSWDDISKRVREKFPSPPKVLVTDGEIGIADALGGPDTLHQRCLFHGKHQLKFALYQDDVKGKDQIPFVKAFAKIEGLQICQAEVNHLEDADRKDLKELLATSVQAFENMKRRLPLKYFPATRQYVLGLIENGLTYLRRLLQGDPAIPVTTNRMESLMSRLALRLKWIGRRWSVQGGLNMLAAVLTMAIHPNRYQEIEALLRGEKGPVVGVIITSLEATWLPQSAT